MPLFSRLDAANLYFALPFIAARFQRAAVATLGARRAKRGHPVPGLRKRINLSVAVLAWGLRPSETALKTACLSLSRPADDFQGTRVSDPTYVPLGRVFGSVTGWPRFTWRAGQAPHQQPARGRA